MRFITRKRPRATAPGVLVSLLLLLPAAFIAAPAAAAPDRPMEFDFAQYRSVNADRYRSLAYADNGRHFFVAAHRVCQIGPRPGNVACSGGSATAPPGVVGVAITGDAAGPGWIPPGTTYRFGSRAGFREPVLKVGTRISVANVTCAAPRKGVVSCSTTHRAFALSRAWHRFYYPRGDRAHDRNPAPKYLPARLR